MSFLKSQPMASTSTKILKSISKFIPLRTLTSTSSTTTSSAFSTPNQASNPTHHLITLRRSAIGLPPSSRLTLEALGLHRLHQSVLHPFSAPLAGKILRVKELVEVKNVTEELGRQLMVRRRGEGSGVVFNGQRVYGGGKQGALGDL